MKKTLIPSLGFVVLAIMACGTQTTQPTTSIDSPTQAQAQPTRAPASTETQSSTNTNASSTVSFANDVLPIFNNSCTDCHGKRQMKAGLDLQTYNKVIAGSFQHIVVVPGDADGSFLVQQLVNGKMPKQGAKLTDDQIKIISDWINQGALNN